MKRMTLLTAMALLFSLFATTAAIAGPGQQSGAGERAGDIAVAQERDREQVRDQDADCQTGDAESACDPAREQNREQVQTRTSVPAQEPEPTREQAQNREQTQTRTSVPAQEPEPTREQAQNREQIGDCAVAAPGADCDKTQEESQVQTRDRLMDKIAVILGPDADSAEYRHMFQWVWMYVFGPFHALFI